jgi:hypothetical protein
VAKALKSSVAPPMFPVKAPWGSSNQGKPLHPRC